MSYLQSGVFVTHSIGIIQEHIEGKSHGECSVTDSNGDGLSEGFVLKCRQRMIKQLA